MSELDVFEARFAAAYRLYLDEAPTEVDAVAVARAVAMAPRRRGLAIEWPGTLRLAPALAWLVLFALLLAALGAALLVGSHRPALGFTCPAGTNPDAPGALAQARPAISYFTPMAFDRRAGRIVVVAGDAGGTAETWTLDVCTNAWRRMRPSKEPGAWSRLVYDVDSDLTIAVDGYGDHRVWAYDLEANTWTAKGIVPATLAFQSRLVYDSASGLVIAQSAVTVPTDPWELWTYDIESDAWTRIQQMGGPIVRPDHAYQELAYDPTVDRLISYDARSAETWLFDLRTGTWSKSGAVTPKVNFGYGNSGGEVAFDEGIGRTVVLSRGRVIAYDAADDRWEILADGWDPDHPVQVGGPTDRSGSSLVYDPVNRRLVVDGGQYPSGDVSADGGAVWVQADDVLAFDPATRAWATLLEAGSVVPVS